MKKTTAVVLDALAIVIVSIISFAAVPVSETFLTAYGFLIAAVLSQLVPAFLSAKAKDIAYKTALHTLSLLYLIAQLAVSILGYSVLSERLIFVAVISSVLLILYIAAVIVAMQIINSGNNMKKRENQKVFFINRVQLELEQIKSDTKDNELAASLDKICDAVKFSNLNSPPEAADVEGKILDEIDNLKKQISADKAREIKAACEKILSLLSERNMICKLYK
ncbi:MAG: hypothetical protein LUF26_03750 [Firmicutes bacterium]|nr:hypothetical protein [Bacillota bacterium]